LRLSKETLFAYTYKANDSTASYWAERIGYFQSKLDLQMMHHLQDVRRLCTSNQLPGFDSTVQKMTKRLTSNFRRGGDKDDTKKSSK
jgi:hypothetical protein